MGMNAVDMIHTKLYAIKICVDSKRFGLPLFLFVFHVW